MTWPLRFIKFVIEKSICRDELNILEKEKSELELDLNNSSDRKHTAKDERQIGQLQGLQEKISDIQEQSKEEQEKCKTLDNEVSVWTLYILDPLIMHEH